MKETNIKVSLTSTESEDEYEVKASIDKEILKYKEFDNTDVTLDRKKNILNRENENILMDFKFDLEIITKNTLYLKDLNQTLEILIKTNRIINEKNRYIIEYEILDNDQFIYEVKIGD